MFALDRPFETPPGAILARGDYLWSVQTIRKARRYEVVSSSGSAGKELTPDERQEALEVPPSISPAVRELAQSWTTQNSNPRAIVNSALQFFQSGFRYSLSPGEYRKNDLEQFLFHRRIGFCEHYAASFATLMRLAGIPARVVVGYLGGEYNDLGHFFLVRQADTHAWCEVWLPEQRMDTSGSDHRSCTRTSESRSKLIFGERHRFRANGSSPKRLRHAKLARSALFTDVRLALETLSYEWDTRLLAFDADVQEVLLDSIGLANRGPFVLIIEILIVAVALLVIYFGWMQLRTRSRADRVKGVV